MYVDMLTAYELENVCNKVCRRVRSDNHSKIQGSECYRKSIKVGLLKEFVLIVSCFWRSNFLFKK